MKQQPINTDAVGLLNSLHNGDIKYSRAAVKTIADTRAQYDRGVIGVVQCIESVSEVVTGDVENPEIEIVLNTPNCKATMHITPRDLIDGDTFRGLYLHHMKWLLHSDTCTGDNWYVIANTILNMMQDMKDKIRQNEV